MKKFFFLAALASIALASCVKNEPAKVDSQKEISFTPVVAKTTKAPTTPVTGEIATSYDTNESFGVFGFYCEEDNYNPASATVYMDNIKCKYNSSINDDADEGTAGAWVPTSTYYWPKNGKLTFSAYSPADAATAGTITCDKKKGLKISGFSVQTDVTNQYDLLYSDRAYNKTTSIGATNPTYDGVDILFHHALSSIHVMVKADVSYPANTITINSINILNAYFNGDFVENLTTGTETDSKATSNWEGHNNEIGTFVIGNSGIDISTTTDYTQYGTTALMLPQAFDHTGSSNHVKLQVNYTIKNGDGTTLPQVSTFDLTTEANTGVVGGVPSTFNQWVKGYRYTYNITIGLKQVYFAPSVDPWENATITVPQI